MDRKAAPKPPSLFLRDAQTGRALRVLLTRPADSASQTADLVAAQGGEALLCPCLCPAPASDPKALALALQQRARFAAVAVTSRYAVSALAAALEHLTPPLTLSLALAGLRVAAVGPRTAQALADHGRPADLISESEGPEGSESSAAGLASLLIAQLAAPSAIAPAQVLFLRAAEARPTLPTALRAAGLPVTEVEAYRMRPATPTELAPMGQALRAGRIDLAPFGSPRTVEIALAALGPNAATLLSTVRVGAIGETTAAALRKAGVRVDVVAKTTSFESLLVDLARLVAPTLP